MPHLRNHWEIEGNAGNWAESAFLFLLFALAALALESTLQSIEFTSAEHNTGERQFTGYKL